MIASRANAGLQGFTSRRRSADRRLRGAARSVASAVVGLLVLSFVTFVATSYESPENIARSALGQETTGAQLQAFIQRHHLDRPVVQRYVAWLLDFVHGNWGVSIATGRPVQSDIAPRLLRTLLLSLLALAFSVPVSVVLGIAMAKRIDRAVDFVFTVGAVVVSALPEFIIGIGLMTVFAVALGWLPVESSAVTFGSLGARMRAYALPVFTLALAMLPYVARMTRATVRETLSAPYVQAAVLRGLHPRTVVWDYAMRNAAIPVLNAIALNIAYLLTGAIIVENVFAFPGLGQALVAAIGSHDAVTVQAIVLLQGGAIIAVTLVVELLAVYFNPRLRG